MFAALFLAFASTAIAAPVSSESKSAPKHWAGEYLEDYAVYHSRYLALSCYDQHNTSFFDECCRPMLATETLVDNRAPYCSPNMTQVESASAYEATASSEASGTASADVAAASDYTYAVSSAAPSASSAWVAPTSKWVAPTTTSTWTAPAETSKAAEKQQSSGGDTKSGGYATYFYQNGNAGACGTVHGENDKVVAIDSNGYWGSDFSQGSSYCGRWVNIKNTNNGKTVTAMVADVCPTCNNGNSLDLSVGAFTAIASESDGMVPIEWSFA